MTASSYPYCGSCGADVFAYKSDDTDVFCPSCGMDLNLVGFAEYPVVPEPGSSEPEPQPEVVEAPAEDATKAVLLAWLEGRGVTGVDGLTKADLWDYIDGIVG